MSEELMGWTAIDGVDFTKSLRWILVENNAGEHGIRLAIQEDAEWKCINEKGGISWLPLSLRVLLTKPLDAPIDVPYPYLTELNNLDIR